MTTLPDEPAAAAARPPMPPVVYVPTTPEAAQEERQVVMHRVEDGRTALYTYSAPDRLDRFYLPGTPWVLCDVASLQRIHDQTPYDLLFVDVDPGLRDEGTDEGDGDDGDDGADTARSAS